MAGLHFDITGDNSNFMEKLRQTENGIRQTTKDIEKNGLGIEDMFGRITKAAAGLGAAFSAQQFASQVMRVRGEFQQLEVAFNTMLGSAEKANELMGQLTRTAAITPFGLQDVAGGAKQLLAYGVASEEVNDTLIRLGDIAAGLSIPLNDLVYLYGTTMTQGRMFTQDLRQFQGRGIPLAEELAKQFGVTKDKVGELVTAGKVGFEEMKKGIISMTSEGGKFGGLMEAQSKTITGQISNIEDAIDGMFNQIGQSSEGVINAALGGVSALVENWEKVADAIGYAVSAYGAYKAALMVTSAIDSVKTNIASNEEIEGLKNLLGIKEEVKNADLEAAVASGTLSQAKAQEMAMLRQEATQRLEILKLKEEEAKAEEAAALEAFNIAKQEKEAADERLENMQNLYEAALEQGDASYEAYATEQLQTASANANTAATRLNTAERNLNTASSNANAASQAANTFATNANTIANNANTKSLGLMKAAALQLQTILKGLYTTMMANPLALVIGAVGALTYSIYKFSTRATAAEEVTKRMNDSLEELTKKHEEQKKNIDDLVSSLGNLELSEGTRITNFQKLKQEYPQILKDINSENEFLKEKHRILQLINEEQGKQRQEDDKKLLENAKQRYDFFKDRYDKGYTISNVSEDGGYNPGSTLEAMNAWKSKVDEFTAKVAQPELDKYLNGLKELSDIEISSVIEDTTHILQALENAGDNAIGYVSELNMELSKSQIQTLKSSLQDEQKSRGGVQKSASEWLRQYKKEYDDATKAVNDFMSKKNEMSETLFERGLKELTDKRDAAKKKYEDAGGSSKSDEKQIDDRKKKERELADELLNIRRKNQQDELELMEEGSEKKLKQIELDYQKELDAIEKQERELKDKQGGSITSEQQSAITSRRLLAEKTRAKAILEVEKGLIEKYQSNAQKRLEIEKQYNKDIQELQKARTIAEGRGDKKAVDNLTESIAKATSEKGKALMSHDLDVLKQTPEYIQAFEDLENTSTETLQFLVEQFEKVKESAAESLTPEALREYTTTMEELWDEIHSRNPFEAIIEYQKEAAITSKELADAQSRLNRIQGGEKILKSSYIDKETGKIVNVYWELEEAIEAVRKAKDKDAKATNKQKKAEKEASEIVEKLASSLKEVGDTIGGTAGQCVSLIGDIASFANMCMVGTSQVSQTASKAIQAVEKASVILGIVSAAIQILQKISDLGNNKAFKEYEAYADKIKEINALTDAVNEYKIAVLEAQKEENNWFSSNNLKELRDYKAIQQEAYKAYTDKLKEAQAIYQNESGGGWLTGAFNWVMGNLSALSPFDWWKDIWGQGGYDEGTTAAVNNLRIETRKKSSGFLGTGIGGKSQKTENLIDWARNNNLGELFNEDGFINVELAKLIIDNHGDKLVGETRDTLEELIELKEKYDEYLSQLREYVSSMYEPLVDNFVDSLWTWFDEGKDALDTFKDYASDTFRDIVSDMLRTIVLEKVVGSFSDDIANIYEEYAKGAIDETELMKRVGERTEGLVDSYETQIPALQAMMEQVESYFNQAGIDLHGDSSYSQEATSKGFGTEMTHEDAGELSGRFAALQISNEEIKNQMIQSVVLYTQMLSLNSQSNGLLSDILAQHAISNGYLSDIAKYSKMMTSYGEKIDKIIENTQNL